MSGQRATDQIATVASSAPTTSPSSRMMLWVIASASAAADSATRPTKVSSTCSGRARNWGPGSTRRTRYAARRNAETYIDATQSVVSRPAPSARPGARVAVDHALGGVPRNRAGLSGRALPGDPLDRVRGLGLGAEQPDQSDEHGDARHRREQAVVGQLGRRSR